MGNVVPVSKEALDRVVKNLGKEDKRVTIADSIDHSVVVMKVVAHCTKSLKATSVEVGRKTLIMNC